jgi:nucleotide-binding universal stress UspA family protein
MKKILICTDGSQYSRVCCEYGAWLAQKVGAEIELLYVTDLRQFEVPLIADLSGSLGIQPYQAVLGQLQELEKKKAKVILDDAVNIFNEASTVECKTTHRTGLLVDCIGDCESEPDIILLGKRGENADFASEHLGSTMERVVRASSKPCLVTSRTFQPIHKVLLAYDGGDSCMRAVRFLASSPVFQGLELHIVIVAGPNEDDSMIRLREAEVIAREGGFTPTCQMLHGTTEEQISDYVSTNEISLLVMGAYGHTRIRHLIIGSTTTDMIRTCRIPVLLFR